MSDKSEQRERSSVRTVLTTMYLAALILGAAWLCRDAPTVAGYAIAGLAFLSLPVAARHSVGDLALGGGVKGAWKVLTTDAQPGQPPAAP